MLARVCLMINLNGVAGDKNELTDEDGDGIYSGVVSVPEAADGGTLHGVTTKQT